MGKFVVNQSQRRMVGIAMLAAVIVGAWFLHKYFGLLAVAAITAYLFSPIFIWFKKKGQSDGAAAALTFLTSLLVLIVPFITIVLLSVRQIDHLLQNIDTATVSASLGELGQRVITTINNVLASFGSSNVITTNEIIDSVKGLVEKASASVLEFITSSVGNFFSLFTDLIIYVFVFVALLRYGDMLIGKFNTINPLGKRISEMYVKRIELMTKATVRGQFIIATLQGFASAVGLAIAGIEGVFFFSFMVLTAFSFIPLGAGIITIPIGVVLILLGDIWQGLFLILWHVLFVTNIDNFLRPYLVPREARLNSALMLLSVFAGMGIFGFIGIVLGPVLMIVITTTFAVYLEVYHNIEMEKPKLDPEKGFLSKLRHLFHKKKKTA